MNTKEKIIKYISIFAILLLTGACSEDIMDEIDTNPNNPTDVPINLLMPNVTIGVPFNVSGTDIAWYSSIFVEHTAGVHGQMRDADRRANLNSQLSENAWSYYIYPQILLDLKLIIEKGSEGGSEEGNWHNVGIAQVLFAYTLFVVTDTWGRVPYSEALLGSANRYPAYDDQAFIYQEMLAMLDDAIVNLEGESTASPGGEDYIFSGNLDMWVKTAYALKARHYNRLSNRLGAPSATDALEAINNAYERGEGFIFDDYGTDIRYNNPWFRQEGERGHHAVSLTLYNIMNGLNDPRIPLWFTQVQGEYIPAQNGTAAEDQSGLLYSRISPNVQYDVAPLPILTYDELKFVEAECHLRKSSPDPVAALNAYLEAVSAALERAGVAQSDIDTYMAQEDVVPSTADDLTLEDIMIQKYISLWPYGSIEAWAEWRRTGFPAMTNPLGNTPRRFPYPQNEISGNGENVPDVTVNNGVWWDDGSED